MILSSNPLCNPLCNSCHYKNLDYNSQLNQKNDWAQIKLKKWEKVIYPIRHAPENEKIGYRSKTWLKVSFQNEIPSFGQYRSKKIEGKWEKEFISWDSCPLHSKSIEEIIIKLKKIIPKNSITGVWFGPPHLVIVSKNNNLMELKTIPWKELLVSPFFQAWFHSNPQVGRHIFGHLPIEPLSEYITSQPIRAFRQLNQTLLSEARDLAVKWLIKDNPEMVLDLYCGTGELSLLLPQEINWLGIDLSKDAANFAKEIRPRNEAFAGKVEHRLMDPQVCAKIQKSYTLFLNPPRLGLTSKTQEILAHFIKIYRPKAIAYLSCSASSLSRSLNFFEEKGFEVKELRPYDFFPQTEHFETLAILGDF
jgi:tRNA/tmRNA/rRNA uracil-C5-methylase (TrmA/RlmC/RlmD family)